MKCSVITYMDIQFPFSSTLFVKPDKKREREKKIQKQYTKLVAFKKKKLETVKKIILLQEKEKTAFPTNHTINEHPNVFCQSSFDKAL